MGVVTSWNKLPLPSDIFVPAILSLEVFAASLFYGCFLFMFHAQLKCDVLKEVSLDCTV